MDSADEQSSLNIGRYWALVCHRRWWIIAALFTSWSIAVVLSRLLPAKYRSETVILVEQQKVPERYVESNVAVDLQQQRLQSITQQILSRTRLLAIAQNYRLYANEGKRDPDALVDRMRKDITIELEKASQNQLTSFKVSYSASTPRLAQQITGELTSFFIQDSQQIRIDSSKRTTAFLANELQSAGTDLAQQEQRLRDFKTKYLGELPEQLQGNLQILAGLQGRLQSENEALNQAEQHKLYLESLLGQYKSLRGGAANADSSPTIPALEQQLLRMRNQLNDLSARYTPEHPDIVRLKEQIAATEKLQEKIEQEARSGKKTDSSLPAVTPAEIQAMSPMMQIESQIKANQLEIAHRKQEVQSVEAEIRQYEGRLNLTPVREQQLAAVTRDYQQSRANYESLLAKRQESERATDLVEQQQGEQFRVLDPPNLPLKPYFPDHFKFSLAGLGVGTCLAFGLLALLEVADARIYREEDLRDLTSAPVLAGIPALSTPAEQRNQSRRLWLEAAGVSLLVVCISVVTLFTYLKG
jgi:polysaccharide chain length determinant protein (PEP-CTERM system associated)